LKDLLLVVQVVATARAAYSARAVGAQHHSFGTNMASRNRHRRSPVVFQFSFAANLAQSSAAPSLTSCSSCPAACGSSIVSSRRRGAAQNCSHHRLDVGRLVIALEQNPQFLDLLP